MPSGPRRLAATHGVGLDLHPEVVTDVAVAVALQERRPGDVGGPGRGRASSSREKLVGPAIAEVDEERSDAPPLRAGMGAGEELDLVLAVPPDVRETEDLVRVGDEEGVEPWIGTTLAEACQSVVGREARDPLMGERAGVEKRAERNGVGVCRRAGVEVLIHDDPFARSHPREPSLREPAERGGGR